MADFFPRCHIDYFIRFEPGLDFISDQASMFYFDMMPGPTKRSSRAVANPIVTSPDYLKCLGEFRGNRPWLTIVGQAHQFCKDRLTYMQHPTLPMESGTSVA